MGAALPPSLHAQIPWKSKGKGTMWKPARLLKLQPKIHGCFFVHTLSNVYLDADKTELTDGLEASPDYCEKRILAVRRGTPAVEFDRVWEKQGRCILPPI